MLIDALLYNRIKATVRSGIAKQDIYSHTLLLQQIDDIWILDINIKSALTLAL